MWGKIIIPMYRLWLHGLYGLYGPRCPLSPKRLINLIISLSYKEVWCSWPLLTDLLYIGTLSSPCRHGMKTLKWCSTELVPDGHVWRHRDKGSTPGSHFYTIIFRLFVPHLEAFPGYMQSVPEICATICGSITFAHADQVCRPTPHAASISSSGAIRLVLMPYQMEYWSVYSLMKVLFHLGWNDEHDWDEIGRLLGQRPNPPDTLGELGEALPAVWLNILQTFLPNLITPMQCQSVACVNAKGGQNPYW